MIGAIILKKLMMLIQKRMHLDEEPLPQDHFDLIAGSGTGGLLAIMLGRLGMSATQCATKYADLAGEVFPDSDMKSHTAMIPEKGCFSATTLKNAVKRII